MYFAGANGEISPEEFAYVNESDLSDGKVRHTSWSAAVFGGVLLADGVLVSVNYKRQVAYKANDTAAVCSPIKSPGSLSCSDQTIGPPGDPKRSHQTGIEVRKIFNEYFALSPKLTRDWTHDLTGAELPIYLPLVRWRTERRRLAWIHLRKEGVHGNGVRRSGSRPDYALERHDGPAFTLVQARRAEKMCYLLAGAAGDGMVRRPLTIGGRPFTSYQVSVI